MTPAHITVPRRARRTTTSLAALVVAALGLAACGGSDPAETGSTTADVPTVVTAPPTAAPEPVDTEPATTEPAITEPTTTEPPADDAGLVIDGEPAAMQLTPELTTFADENRQLLEDWSAQLTAFGDEAMDHLENVSEAPAAPGLRDVSDQVADAIGPETTDPGLVAARDFASTISEALTYSANGDQETALTVLFELQDQRDTVSATLDQFDL